MATTTAGTPANPTWTPHQFYTSSYNVPLTPNSRSQSITGNVNGDPYHDPFMTPGALGASSSPPPTPSPPFMDMRSSSLGSMYTPAHPPTPHYVPPSATAGMANTEGSSASLRVFPQSTVYTPTQPLPHLHGQHLAMGLPGYPRTNLHLATGANGLTNATTAAGLSAGATTAATRKRLRENDPYAIKEDSAEDGSGSQQDSQSNLAPPTLFNQLFAAAATSAHGTTDLNAGRALHIHTSMESIQASLDSLQAVQASQAAAAAAQAAANAAAAERASQQESQSQSSPNSTASNSNTPTYPSPLTTSRRATGKAAAAAIAAAAAAEAAANESNGKPKRGGGGKRAKISATQSRDTTPIPIHHGHHAVSMEMPPPAPVIMMQHMEDAGGRGGADEDDGTRKSKHRLIEKQRRDELKKNMETLSGLINYAQSTNKNGVVCSAIAFLNAQRAELVVERERSKALKEHVERLEKQLRDSETQHAIALQNLGSSVAGENTAMALVPQENNKLNGATPPGTVSFKQYQALFLQYQEIQLHYTELTTSVASMKGFLQGGGSGVGGGLNGGGQNNMKKKAQAQLVAPLSPSYPPHQGPQRSTSPFSPFHTALRGGSAADMMDESEGNGLLGAPSTEYDVFGFGQQPSVQTPGGMTAGQMRRPSLALNLDGTSAANNPALQAHLSQALKHALNPSPIDYRCTFKTEGTARVLVKDNIVIDATERFCHDVGYSYSELIGLHMDVLTPTVKQPMCRLVSQRSTHGCEAMPILNCYKTKKGGVVFRYGILEAVWEHSRCCGTGGAMKGEAPPPSLSGNVNNPSNFGSSYMEVMTPSSSDSTESGSAVFAQPSIQPMQPAANIQGGSPDVLDKFTFPVVPPCPLCGSKPKYHSFIGFPTHYTEIDHYLMLSVRTAIRAFDPDISMVGLELDEFYSRGRVTYEVPSHPGTKMTKTLPMRFVQAVQLYDQMARTASTSRTSPPRIEL